MQPLLPFAVSALLFTVACSKGGGGQDAASCPAFSLAVDGQAVAGFTGKLAFTHKKGEERTHQVSWFNHDKATCEEITSRQGRPVPEGEVSFAAFTGGQGPFGKGVQLGSHSQMGIDVALVSAAPAKAGDKVSLCIPETTFKPGMGPMKDKSVTVKGLVEGSWCGFMDWD
jgi:hypothetical protein